VLLPGNGCEVFRPHFLFGCFPRLLALVPLPERLGGSQECSHFPAIHFGNWTAVSPAAVESGAEFCAEDCILPRRQSDEQLVLFSCRELRNPSGHFLALGWPGLVAWTHLGGDSQQVPVDAEEVNQP
jgi:hypothetical protein